MAHRRGADEWARLLRELERSGQTPTAFAKARGIRPDTLKWWRWRLASKAKAVRPKPRLARVSLVEVEPVGDLGRLGDTTTATPVWELVAPTGHALRVYDRGGLRVLKAALSTVARSRHR